MVTYNDRFCLNYTFLTQVHTTATQNTRPEALTPTHAYNQACAHTFHSFAICLTEALTTFEDLYI